MTEENKKETKPGLKKLTEEQIEQHAAELAEENTPTETPPEPEGPVALIVEDDFDASIIFARALEANGFQSEQIYDGAKARARIKEGHIPDIVLLDMHLPNVSGKELLKQVRTDDRYADVKVIIVTADSGMADMLREDADLVLLKPTTYTQVRDFTARLVRRPR